MKQGGREQLLRRKARQKWAEGRDWSGDPRIVGTHQSGKEKARFGAVTRRKKLGAWEELRQETQGVGNGVKRRERTVAGCGERKRVSPGATMLRIKSKECN